MMDIEKTISAFKITLPDNELNIAARIFEKSTVVYRNENYSKCDKNLSLICLRILVKVL